MDRKALMLAQFELVGEDVVRKSSGKVLNPSPNSRGYRYVSVADGTREGIRVRLHRLKYLLAHGWLPDEVDHADGNPTNNSLSNLRASTHTENLRNSKRRKGRTLPRGVYRRPSGRYQAAAHVGGSLRTFGTYDNPEEAGRVVEDKLRAEHGPFYRDTGHV